jgi:hypothetical protein
LCWMILRWEVSFCTTQKETSPLKFFQHKKKLSPQNRSTQNETSHLKINQHKKKLWPQNRSKQKETSHLKINQHKRDLSLRSHKTQKETSYLKIIQRTMLRWEVFLCWMNLRWEVSFCVDWFWVRGFVLHGMTSKWEVSFVLNYFKVRGLFCVDWFLLPQNHSTQKEPSPQNISTQKETSHLKIMLNDVEVRVFFYVEWIWGERFLFVLINFGWGVSFWMVWLRSERSFNTK